MTLPHTPSELLELLEAQGILDFTLQLKQGERDPISECLGLARDMHSSLVESRRTDPYSPGQDAFDLLIDAMLMIHCARNPLLGPHPELVAFGRRLEALPDPVESMLGTMILAGVDPALGTERMSDADLVQIALAPNAPEDLRLERAIRTLAYRSRWDMLRTILRRGHADAQWAVAEACAWVYGPERDSLLLQALSIDDVCVVKMVLEVLWGDLQEGRASDAVLKTVWSIPAEGTEAARAAFATMASQLLEGLCANPLDSSPVGG